MEKAGAVALRTHRHVSSSWVLKKLPRGGLWSEKISSTASVDGVAVWRAVAVSKRAAERRH